MKQKFVSLLLLALFILWLPHIRADASGSGVPHDMETSNGVFDAADQDSGAGIQGDGMDQDNVSGMDTPQDSLPGDFITAPQPFMEQYQADSVRKQDDSEILRFALAAAFSLWASRTITQRRSR